MRRVCFGVLLASLLLGLAAGARAQATGHDVVLVLDVSNSMWGRIDEVSKIEIARAVIADLLQDWDPATGLGLVAYGHRRERDCGDIELVVPIGPVDPPAFTATVNGLVPRGRTPLTEAVRLAAETLGFRDNPATVVLLSDGIETCDADPCALAAELERAGVDFVAHVIGFDVAEPEAQAQLACIAENTGGVFLAASNAEELSAALIDVTEQSPPPPGDEPVVVEDGEDGAAGEPTDLDVVLDALITLEAVDDTTGAVLDDGVSWTVLGADDQQAVLAGEAVARPQLILPEGAYVAIAEIEAGTGQVEFTVEAGVPATRRVHFASLVGPASLSVESAIVPMSSRFAVAWDGPDDVDDHITIVPAGADDGAFGTIAYTAGGDPAAMLAPDRPGAYELRYVHGPTRDTLARLPMTILEVPTSVSAPDPITVGSTFAVAWQGPDGPGDMITLVPVGTPEPGFAEFARTAGGNPAQLVAPGTAGDYEVRYLSAQSSIVLAAQAVRLVAAATLAAPDQAVAGSRIAVAWTGPGNPDDRIVVAPAGAAEGEYGNQAAVGNGSPADLQLPETPGAYEIRYLAGAERRTLAAIPITVTEPPVTLDAPAEVESGSTFEVAWTGPDNDNDRIVVVEAGAAVGQYISNAYTRDGSPAVLGAPDTPGAYEIRYRTGQYAETLAARPITVVPVPARVEAPASVVAGARFEVTWTGPGNDYDRIVVVMAGADPGLYQNFAFTADGSPVTFTAPDAAGDYEVRYMTGQQQVTLATAMITVTAASATLRGPPSVGAGGQFEVAWTGPANNEDRIVVTGVGAPEGEFTSYSYANYGSPATLSAPDQPGDYEVRYITGQSDATLASILITVTPVTASLQAPASVAAGQPFEVVWTGPANHPEDRILIVEAGADAGLYLSNVFAQDGSPATLFAPDTRGAYEVRYMTGWSDSILAAVPIEVR